MSADGGGRAAVDRQAVPAGSGGRGPSLLGLVAASFVKDFAIARTYRLSFVLDLTGTLFTLVLFYALGRLVGGSTLLESTGDRGYFAFAVLGLMFLRLAQAALSSQAEHMRGAQSTGTLEVLLAGPAPAWKMVIAASSYDLIYALLGALSTLVLAVALFDADLSTSSVGFAIAVLALVFTTVFVLALGLVMAAVTIVFKQAAGVLGMAMTALALLGGVWVPVESLPPLARELGQLLPFTWGLDVLRAAVLDGEFLWAPFATLVVVDLVLVCLGALALEWSVRHVRVTGSIGLY